jgi:hypothetical protein
VLVAKAMPPLGQYFSPLARQMSPSLPPKGTDPQTLWLFPCTRAVFRGPPEGAMIAVMDPRQADAAVVAKGHAPVVAGLVPAVNRIASEHHDCRGTRPEGS